MRITKIIQAAYHIFIGLVWLAAVLVLGFFLLGCTTTRLVPVPEVHEHHHYQKDSVIRNDSVIQVKQTTIMQLDSAEMLKYGIRLKQAERAWLVKTEDLERQIERLEAMSVEKDTVRDSIPQPYPVYIEKELTLKDKLGIYLKSMGICFGILLACIIIWMVTRWKNRLVS